MFTIKKKITTIATFLKCIQTKCENSIKILTLLKYSVVHKFSPPQTFPDFAVLEAETEIDLKWDYI